MIYIITEDNYVGATLILSKNKFPDAYQQSHNFKDPKNISQLALLYNYTEKIK